MAIPPPRGIYVPVPTFFKATAGPSGTHEFDVEAQGAHAVYLASSGIKGIVLLGSTGEGILVHPRERAGFIRKIRQYLDAAGHKDFIVQAGVITQVLQEALEQIQEAKEAGAGYAQVLAPGYLAAITSQEGLIQWFTQLADKSPLPIIIYNWPDVSNGLVVKADTYATLAKHPNIVGSKTSHGDLGFYSQLAWEVSANNSAFHIYTGYAQVILPLITVGGSGSVDGISGYFPKTVVRLFELSDKASPAKEEVQERLKLQYHVTRVSGLVSQHGVIGIKEVIHRLRGFGEVGGSRLPLLGGLVGRR